MQPMTALFKSKNCLTRARSSRSRDFRKETREQLAAQRRSGSHEQPALPQWPKGSARLPVPRAKPHPSGQRPAPGSVCAAGSPGQPPGSLYRPPLPGCRQRRGPGECAGLLRPMLQSFRQLAAALLLDISTNCSHMGVRVCLSCRSVLRKFRPMPG